jgi:Tol biopolymer transport system component
MRSRREPAPLLLGQASQLTSERGLEVQPSMSPDGRYVAYAAGSSLLTRIAVRPVAGGRARWLTADTTENQWLPRWSPDGRRILFLSRGGVFSAPASGGLARQEVASRPGAIVTSATWSPDGRAIAYVRGDSLLARTVDSDETRLITTGTDLHSCRWSPDGAWLACVAGNSFYVTVGAVSGVGPMFGNLAPSRIVLVPATGGRPVSVTDSGSLHQSPVWSQDGRTLYYVSNRHGPRDVYALDVHARGSARRRPVRVTTGIGAQSVDFSVDGARLVYVAYSSTANVWSMPIPVHPVATPASATPASAVPVTSGNQTVEGVRVSHDGRWLVYDSDLSGNSDVYRVPALGGEPERLTRSPSDEFRGTLSPDGRELAFHSFQTGSRNIFLLTLDSGVVRQLTRSTDQLAMANWSPDGTALSFFNMTKAEVLVMRRDRRGRWGVPRRVATHGWRPEWSPDGRTIAFVSPVDGRIGLVSVDSGRGRPRDVYAPDNGDPLAELAVFAASGRELYFKSHDAEGRASFWSIPATGGRPLLLVRFDDPAWSSNRFDFASDGKRFYFTAEDRQGDVWIAQVVKR